MFHVFMVCVYRVYIVVDYHKSPIKNAVENKSYMDCSQYYKLPVSMFTCVKRQPL